MILSETYIKVLKKKTRIKKIINDQINSRWIMQLKKKTNRHRQMSTCHECANLRIIYLHIRNKFWKDTFNAHKEKNVWKLINRSEYACKTLWCNKNFKIN